MAFFFFLIHNRILLYPNLNVYVCKTPLGDLNPGPYPLHSTSTYTCKITIAPRVCGGYIAC